MLNCWTWGRAEVEAPQVEEKQEDLAKLAQENEASTNIHPPPLVVVPGMMVQAPTLTN
jgi:hypothetical protein